MDYLPNFPLAISPLMAFGLILLIGSIGGYVAHRYPWLPSITGFMVVGFIVGPSGLNLLSDETIANSSILIDIALALILYRLGLSLNAKLLWRSPQLLFTSMVESIVTFGVVTLALTLFDVPIIISALVAAISVSSSPAVLLHVAHEVGASGETTEKAKTLVALNNLMSFMLFSLILPAMHYSGGADWSTIILQPIYRLLGSVVVGILIGYGLHTISFKTIKAPQYQLSLVIGAIMLAIGLALALKLSTLLVPLMMGIMVKSLEKEVVVSNLEFGPAFELFFITLFVMAGAGLHFEELIKFAPIVFALVLARSFAKILSVTTTTYLQNKNIKQGFSTGLLMVPMAGLAIGLVNSSSVMFPDQAPIIAAIVLGAVTIFETVGPPIAVFAFRFVGETSLNKEVSLDE